MAGMGGIDDAPGIGERRRHREAVAEIGAPHRREQGMGAEIVGWLPIRAPHHRDDADAVREQGAGQRPAAFAAGADEVNRISYRQWNNR